MTAQAVTQNDARPSWATDDEQPLAAMALGKLQAATLAAIVRNGGEMNGYSGQADFYRDAVADLVRLGLVDRVEPCGPCNTGQDWAAEMADTDEDQAAEPCERPLAGQRCYDRVRVTGAGRRVLSGLIPGTGIPRWATDDGQPPAWAAILTPPVEPHDGDPPEAWFRAVKASKEIIGLGDVQLLFGPRSRDWLARLRREYLKTGVVSRHSGPPQDAGIGKQRAPGDGLKSRQGTPTFRLGAVCAWGEKWDYLDQWFRPVVPVRGRPAGQRRYKTREPDGE